MVATTHLTLDGDRAKSRTILFNPMVIAGEDGKTQTFFIGLWYRDELVSTAEGWRIDSRYEEMAYTHNAPMMAPAPEVPS